MLIANEQVIRNTFFLPDSAWKIPMLVSMWNSFVFAVLLFCVSCELPLIAVTGDTLEAFFAGDRGRQQYNQKTNHRTSNQTAYTELKKRYF